MKAFAANPADQKAIATLTARPDKVGTIGTTCVATMMSGGHALNALPQRATANVNCRIFPGEDPQEVRATLERVAADPQVSVTIVPQLDSAGKPVPVVTVPPSPLLPEVVQAMDKTIGEKWPGVPLVATMSAGASDGKFTRIAGIPTLGISCMFYELGDNRAHGKDERVEAKDFYDGVDFNYRLMRAISSRN